MLGQPRGWINAFEEQHRVLCNSIPSHCGCTQELMPSAGSALLRRTVIDEVLRLGIAPALLLSNRGAANLAASDKESWYKTVTVSPAEVWGHCLGECYIFSYQDCDNF